MNFTSNRLDTAFFALAFSAFASLAATPQITSVAMTQNPSRTVTVAYTLEGGDAVVTLDVQTNANTSASSDDPGWTSIGGAAVCNAQGDVWKLVEAGSRAITWEPALSWPDHKIPDGGARAVVTAWTTDNTPDYMVVDISSAATAATPRRYYPAADFVPGGVTSDLYKTTMLLMRKIMARDITWTMGSTTAEGTQRSVTTEENFNLSLTNNYYIGVFEITQTQWGLVATNSAQKAYFSVEGGSRPMENISFNEIRNTHRTTHASSSSTTTAAGTLAQDPTNDSFLGLLRLKTGLDFDLPSEAQWEYACRAGNGSGYYPDGSAMQVKVALNGDSNQTVDANLSKIARYAGNVTNTTANSSYDPDCGTAIVGSYAPNDWGLYDMLGNVLEWCGDWYEADVSANAGFLNVNPNDVAKTLSGATVAARVRRGGSWQFNANYARSARRLYADPSKHFANLGFRVICTAGLK
ncbi:MAG: formylglycine-generating enzyme family protein [Kiritimatiellae bacterium]|nr:formylglycine-generating enzyme family protein [Kiritimatiellia bacterium]